MPVANRQDWFIDHRLSPAQLAQYAEDGYLSLGRTLTDSGIEEMRRQCMQIWEEKKQEFDPNGTWLKNSLLPNIHHWAQIAKEFYFRGPLVDVAQQIVGPNIKGATSQLTFKLRGNTKPFGWHQDNGYGELDPFNTLTTLTALDDADVQNGCLWLIPRSHQQGQIDVSSQFNLEKKAAGASIELTVDEQNAIPIPMCAGESLIFHCWMLHKSEGNMSPDRDRRILFLRYADADAVEVYNERRPRLGKLLCGRTRFPEVEQFERELD
jgi:hypothetical protein